MGQPMTDIPGKIERFPGNHQPIPPKIAYPSEYGLMLAASRLIGEYGTDGAVNKLIEMAEFISAGGKPTSLVSRRRVEPEHIYGRK